jgi:hypothetical protein
MALVVLAGEGVKWAIDARNVLRAHLALEWKGAPPIDVAALWGVAWQGESSPSHIVLVSTRRGPRAFSSVRLAFRSVDQSKILPLPNIVAREWGGRLVRGIVFSESEPATLVLDPEAFGGSGMRQ